MLKGLRRAVLLVGSHDRLTGFPDVEGIETGGGSHGGGSGV